MPEKESSCGCCCCCCCICIIIVLGIFFLFLGGYFVVEVDSPACNAVANKQPYIKWINNVTVKRGVEVDIHCIIMNFDLVDKVSWMSSEFGAEIVPELPNYYKSSKSQHGVDVAGGWTSAILFCPGYPQVNSINSAFYKVFSLRFTSVKSEHEGLYTCRVSFTPPTTGSGNLLNMFHKLFRKGYYMDQQFYLSVE